MRKKLMALIMAVSFMGVSSGSALAAKYCKGTVKEVDGKTMVIEIKGKCKCKVGDKVKIKPMKKKAIEGC
ncbi:selenite/tellurite reduction operon protein ExtJ [Thermodesulfatator autotrophicus]|uniref:DUF5666 domain-containing protein n=1 Tax=Thermodesulfatator autotrophicus TaxID=1795632 RepID=A0A177E6Q3_9BACT|nr:hypothetical protein [Thermodesulfatator autotrophicus]OAG27627.1 hypothetical protein TH606_05795 [Thermodesulfatator autotrophicus]